MLFGRGMYLSPVAISVLVTTGAREKQRCLELAELGGIESNHRKMCSEWQLKELTCRGSNREALALKGKL